MNTIHAVAFLFNQHPSLFIASALVLGLFIGSFLNVVIYRLPLMMQREWKKECTLLLHPDDTSEPSDTFNLMTPNSHCPSCKNLVRIWQNIPVLSYLLLLGKCAHCKIGISPRYPSIEFISGLLSAAVAWKWGLSWQTLWAMVFCWSLISLTMIDFDHRLLPDDITLPLLWLGLAINSFGIFTDLNSAVWGAIVGYLSLWSIYWAFKLLTGKEGMGYGDFKLLAALGAWFGVKMLIPIILMSSLSGTIVGVLLILSKKNESSQAIAFGPYLAMGGLLCLFFSKQILNLLGW